MWWTGFKKYKEKYEPQNILHASRGVFSPIFKTCTTIVETWHVDSQASYASKLISAVRHAHSNAHNPSNTHII